MEFHVGSAPARSSAFGHGGLTISESLSEPPLSGFLNRKCVMEAGGKKSKDRSWQTFWCQLKGVALEFHRVDGVKSEGFRPPPRDIYPPPHLAQHKAGFVSVEGAVAEVDYTSQLGKDLQKRRNWLFELTLANNVVYLLQAPNNTQRVQWVQHISRAASGFQGDDIESRKLKAARCSVRHRSRQNVLSLKAGQVVQGDGEEAELVTAVRDNPSMQLLRDRLRAKKELLAQVNRMCYSFLGDTRQLYSEEVRKAASSAVEPVSSSPRRLSLPSPFYSSLNPLNVADPRRASTGAFSATSHPWPCVRSRMLQDHLLVPGAGWSRLRQGEEVVLTGRLASGWLRCVAHREVCATVDGAGTVSVASQAEASADNGLLPSNRHSAASDTVPEAPSLTEGLAATASSGAEAEMFVSDALTPEHTEDDHHQPESSRSHDRTSVSHDQSSEETNTSQNSVTSSPRSMRVARSYSYIAATQTSAMLGPHPRRSLDGSVPHRRTGNRSAQEVEEEASKHSSVLMLEGLLAHLSEAQPRTKSYRFPLVGVVPPSVVEKVPELADLPLVSTAVFSQSPSHSAACVPSPFHSSSQLDTPLHTVSHQQSNGHISTPSHSLLPSTPSHSPLPARKPISSSAPGTPHTTPAHTPSQSPTPSHPTRNGEPPRTLSLSPALSPSKSSRGRRRPHDPVAAVLESGPSLIKRLLPRKKPSKQTSLPEKLSVSRAPTIEEELPYSPSPSPLPPSPPVSPIPPSSPLLAPAMLDFSERESEADMRMRVSSVSGRPIRSTGICLQFGEEESSSDSEVESGSELEPSDKLLLSQSLPSTGGFFHGGLSPSPSLSSALLLPPRLSPDIMAPASLKRAASAHDCLAVQEEEPLSQSSRSKSGSTHSLTSALVRGLHNSFKRNHVQPEESVSPKKRGSSKRKRGSITEPESPKIGGIFKQPPTGLKRFVYLDPRQPKYGFRLESYGRPSELELEVRVFVQSVTPGSHAFMSGLFPGDTILEVNGVSVRSEPVAAVVKKIADVPRRSENKVQLTVMFADGVTRLEKMKKIDYLRYQMKMKQAQLRVMISEESSHVISHMTVSLPPARSVVPASDLPPWSHQVAPTGPAPHLYPYDSVLNEQVALYCGPPSELAADILVLPLCPHLHKDTQNMLTQLVMEGGPGLVDELCLATYCPLGDNITTSGHQLPVHTMYHCVFGNLEESLQKCIWSALEGNCSEESPAIAFWLDGFTAINVSPHSIIEFVRLWLQQGGGNRHKFKKIVFSAATNPEFAKTLLERYFPLAHYYFRAGTPGSVERSRVTQAERTHNPQDQMGEGEGEGEGEGKEVGEGGEGEMGEWGEEGEGEEGGEGVATLVLLAQISL